MYIKSTFQRNKYRFLRRKTKKKGKQKSNKILNTKENKENRQTAAGMLWNYFKNNKKTKKERKENENILHIGKIYGWLLLITSRWMKLSGFLQNYKRQDYNKAGL